MTHSYSEQVCIVTGGNSGVGLMIACGLAKLGMQVILGCRSEEKAAKARIYLEKESNNCQISYLPLDLASLDSVRRFVDLFQSQKLPLNLLINNGGIFAQRGLTQDGFELIWGTNYLGHFFLTQLLLDKLCKSAGSKIVNIASDLALTVKYIDWEKLTQSTPLNFLEAYAVSKACLLIFSLELSKLLANQQIQVNSIHPGFVRSNISLGHKISKYLGLGISSETSAQGIINIITNSPNQNRYFLDYKGRVLPLSPLVKNQELAQQLWRKSEQWISKF